MRTDSSGFSLVETLAALSIVVVGLTGLAHLLVWTGRATAGARAGTMAVVLAQAKMEELRCLAYQIDPLRQPITAPGLAAASEDSLLRSVAGYSDFLDSRGQPVPGRSPPEGMEYVRRWSIVPLPADPENTLVVRVLVSRWNDVRTSGGLLPGDVVIQTVRRRGVS